MLSEITGRARKAGLPPETLVYTGKYKSDAPQLSVIVCNADTCQYTAEATVEQCLVQPEADKIAWINVVGLQDTDLINKIGTHFNIHPLVIEDILNTKQRTKLEEYDSYVFIALKKLNWDTHRGVFEDEQISLVFGPGFLLSFQERKSSVFDGVLARLQRDKVRLRERGSDYLAYSLLDTIIDQYFLVLEDLGEKIEKTEEHIIIQPTPKNAHTMYNLKRQTFLFRKAVWPLREVINHLLRIDGNLIAPFTVPYLRDIYDHTLQMIDTIETFRDMLSNMLDAYLSSLTNRMNEVMKVLTIIATIFIPLTFISSIYGMNFIYMPEIHWRWGYPATMVLMGVVAVGMLIYFKHKKWW